MPKISKQYLIDEVNRDKKASNLFKCYPLYLEEAEILINNGRWLSFITLFGPTIEFFIRETFKTAYVAEKLEELQKITFEDFLAKISPLTSKNEISLMETYNKLNNERKDPDFRKSSEGYKHYFFNYLESKFDESAIEYMAETIFKVSEIRNKVNHADWKGLIEVAQKSSGLNPKLQTIQTIKLDIINKTTTLENPTQRDIPAFVLMISYLEKLSKSEVDRTHLLSLYKTSMIIFNEILS